MNIETLLTILGISVVVTCISRVIAGWTLAGLLTGFVLACLGAVGGWVLQDQLGLPPLYSIPFPADGVLVPVVWPIIGSLVVGIVGSLLTRSRRPEVQSGRSGRRTRR